MNTQIFNKNISRFKTTTPCLCQSTTLQNGTLTSNLDCDSKQNQWNSLLSGSCHVKRAPPNWPLFLKFLVWLCSRARKVTKANSLPWRFLEPNTYLYAVIIRPPPSPWMATEYCEATVAARVTFSRQFENCSREIIRHGLRWVFSVHKF